MEINEDNRSGKKQNLYISIQIVHEHILAVFYNQLYQNNVNSEQTISVLTMLFFATFCTYQNNLITKMG